jgi:lipopolysaccharide transport system permease protein
MPSLLVRHGTGSTVKSSVAYRPDEEEAPADEGPPTPGSGSSLPVRRLERRSGWAALDLREIWRYRELLYFQALRDIKVRYKQTALGALWAVIQPVLTMIVFTLFFGRLANVPSGGVPYPVTTFCALLPWQLFAYALSQSSNSLVDNAEIVAKVYFPRLIMPLSAVIAGLVDFVIAFVVLLGLMAFYGIAPQLTILLLPGFIVLAVAAALAVGLWLSALNVRYRDVKYTIVFLTQFLLFLTPVAYQSSLVPEKWQAVYSLNPMVGVVDGFRWSLLGQESPGSMFFVSAGATVVLLAGGLFYFRQTERTFADVI